jgi:hypothetical protein
MSSGTSFRLVPAPEGAFQLTRTRMRTMATGAATSTDRIPAKKLAQHQCCRTDQKYHEAAQKYLHYKNSSRLINSRCSTTEIIQ